ncbi:MAG: RlmE family RNA methyltransferase [Alphaproteobacteria bacterium]
MKAKTTNVRLQHQKVKTAKGRDPKSTRWLQRQLNDPYVEKAHKMGFRSRAAFKLLELNEKFNFLDKGKVVVDLGSAPGGWSQVASHIVMPHGKIVAIDILPMDSLADVDFVQMDFTDNKAPEKLIEMLGGRKADVVLSDMAANTIGHKSTDHLRIIAILEMAFDFAKQILNEDGVFVAKVFQGGAESSLLNEIKQNFKSVKHSKPNASRKESPETYIVAQGFKK